MGNRAVITTPEKKMGLYLQWNGGRDSVEPMLRYCELKGYRAPDRDDYGWARLAQVASNFFGGTRSVGLNLLERLDYDNGDNGLYIIEGWKIVGREYYPYAVEQSGHDFVEMLHAFDDAMPEGDRLGDYLEAVEVDTGDLEVGDVVYRHTIRDQPMPLTVVGFAEDRWTKRVCPLVEMYDNGADNRNNLVTEETCMVTTETAARIEAHKKEKEKEQGRLGGDLESEIDVVDGDKEQR